MHDGTDPSACSSTPTDCAEAKLITGKIKGSRTTETDGNGIDPAARKALAPSIPLCTLLHHGGDTARQATFLIQLVWVFLCGIQSIFSVLCFLVMVVVSVCAIPFLFPNTPGTGGKEDQIARTSRRGN